MISNQEPLDMFARHEPIECLVRVGILVEALDIYHVKTQYVIDFFLSMWCI